MSSTAYVLEYNVQMLKNKNIEMNESYHECELLGQLDRQTTDWLVLGSLGMTGTNDCSHGMTESLMADLDMF